MSNRKRLEKFFSLFGTDSRVLVIINADPDAIGSAMAVKRLLYRKVQKVSITFFNEISRPDNITLIRVIGADLIHLRDINDREYNRFVTVDSQPDHHECFGMFRYDAIIDHHPVSCDVGRFNDIRPEYGSCSAILSEYLRTAKIKPAQKLATALLMGIKTDTAGFVRQAGINDVREFQYLYPFVNTHLITKIEQAELKWRDMDALAEAIKQRHFTKRRVFSHLGDIANPDQLVIIADFFLKMVSVNWSVISGICDGQLIIVLRNDGLRKGAGATAKEAFGAFGSAGGHKSMARVEIRMEDLEKVLDKDHDIGDWIVSRINKYGGKKTK